MSQHSNLLVRTASRTGSVALQITVYLYWLAFFVASPTATRASLLVGSPMFIDQKEAV